MTTMIETSEPMSPETEALLRRVEELERTVGALREAAVREPAVVEARVAEPLSASDLAAVEERLEERVLERLSTRDSAALEERLVERLAARVPEATAAPVTATSVPAAPLPQPTPGPRWYNRINPFKPRATAPPPVSSGWLLFDLLNEARFLGSMIFDSRFGMGWTSRIVLLCCFVAFFCQEILMAPITYPIGLVPFVGTFIGFCLNKLVTLFIAFFIFKVLARETARYKAYLANLDAA